MALGTRLSFSASNRPNLVVVHLPPAVPPLCLLRHNTIVVFEAAGWCENVGEAGLPFQLSTKGWGCFSLPNRVRMS